MFATLTNLRVRAGLVSTDASRDTDLQLSHDAALALAESYCDRKFAYATEKEEFIHVDARAVSLIRYPIDAIGNINAKGVTTNHVDKLNGMLHFDQNIHEHEMVVGYTGGYKDGAYPADLLLAMYALFDAVWGQLGSGGGGGTTAVAGAIESVTIPDVGTVRFSTGAAAVAATAGAGGDYLSPTIVNILNNYRRETC